MEIIEKMLKKLRSVFGREKDPDEKNVTQNDVPVNEEGERLPAGDEQWLL